MGNRFDTINNSLRLTSNTSTTALTGNLSVSGDLQPSTPFSFRNRIINGAMAIDQRNNGSSVNITSTTTAYTIDRWTAYSLSATQAVQRVSASAGGYQYGLQITGATGATQAVLAQRIESLNAWDLASRQFTVSFVVFNSETAKSLTVAVYTANSVDNFTSTTSITSTPITIPNGWSTQSVTFTGSANVINGLLLEFQFGAIANAATRILTGVQLELGSTATPFERRPHGLEFALCQRYYQEAVIGTNNYGAQYASAPNSFNGLPVAWQVVMRASPSSVTFNKGAGGAAYWVVVGTNSVAADSTTGISVTANAYNWFIRHTRQAGGSAPTSASYYVFESDFTIKASAEL